MPNTSATFKQIDVTRAVKGALAAGLPVARIEIDHLTGKTVIHCDQAGEAGSASAEIDRALGLR